MSTTMRASLRFLKDQSLYESIQPYKLHGFPEVEATSQTNCIYEDVHDIYIEDIRESLDDFRIDRAGFEFIKQPSNYDLKAEYFEVAGQGEKIIVSYVKETMGLVRRHMKAKRVIAIDWRVSAKKIMGNYATSLFKFRRNHPSAIMLFYSYDMH